MTVANPTVGTYTVTVRAAATASNQLPNASANLVVRQKPRIPLNFASGLNAGGGSHTDTKQLIDGEKTFYEVAVPTSVDGQPVIGWILRNSFQQGNGTIRVYKTWGDASTGITVNSRTAVIAPPFLTPGDTWYVEVQGIGLTNYTITSEPVTLHLPAWAMPTGHNVMFGDSGAALPGDKGYDAQGTYPFNTPPLRPGDTYYVGFKANNDATFTFSSATSGGTIGSLPVLDFYTGVIDTSILPDTKIPPNSSRLYQISVPPEATRLKWTSTHASTVQMRLEQGTLPGTSGTAQHYYSSGTNSAPNYALSASSWPWQPNQTYYLRIVNNAASEATVTLNMKGKNAATEDEDTDGLPDAWELTYFPTGSIYSYNGSSDPDLDGVTNAVELVDGTNPNNINSALYFVTVNASGGTVLRSPSLSKYPRGSSLSLTSTPDSGLAFIGWAGGVTGTGSPANLTVNSNMTITATLLPIETALETNALTWSTGGSGLWYGQNTTTHDGVDAAQSGIIGNSQESWMETSVTGPGTLDFWWKVSSQANGDFLQFILDGAIQSGSITGTVNWTQKSISIPTGNHTLRWRYIKDGSTISGSDAGWVDEVIWSPSNAYSAWAATEFSAGQLADPLISGPNADPDKDGLANLLECAFNLNPLISGNTILIAGSGTTGLPIVSTIGSGATTRLRIEYLRRKASANSGLTYTPQFGSSLAESGPDGWSTATDTETVQSIDAEWERETIEEDATGKDKRFGRVKVTAVP